MRLCLNMIVRDEAQNILATLDSVTRAFRPDTWVIHDTGSRDGTAELVTSFFQQRGLPGLLEHHPWRDFASNRQAALEAATGRSDYLLVFDADDLVQGQPPALPDHADAITLNTRRGTARYPSRLILRNDGRYRWRGVVHEAPYHRGGPERLLHLAGDYHIDSRSAGSRARDPATYYHDARALERAIETLAPEDQDLLPRYCFYCANSWRDAGAPREAMRWYRRRIALGGWRDEVYLSWLGLGIGLLAEAETEGVGVGETGAKNGAGIEAAAEAFRSGHEICPERAECLYHLARLERGRGRLHMALALAEQGCRLPAPAADRLFVWQDIHAYWMTFEHLQGLQALGRLDGDAGRAALARLQAAGAPAHLWGLLGLDTPPDVAAGVAVAP